MKLDELDLSIPEELIAQSPAEPRDSCRLLRLERESGRVSHHVFSDLPALLRPGDVLVVNDSRVLAARVHLRRPTGGRVELLFLRPDGGGDRRWEVLARPSGRLRPGMVLTGERPEADSLEVTLRESRGGGRWAVDVAADLPVPTLLSIHGEAPLPPYIKQTPARPEDYQTVYARSPGSAAAPTAGLHFTSELLAGLADAGVDVVRVTLHVGLDTFRPIQTDLVEEHPIHREYYSVSKESVERLNRARQEGRRLVAVGTTSVRVLETLYASGEESLPAGPTEGWTDLYITPGYRFRAVGALVTNFHLPRTSLLALVMAFAGPEPVRRAYQAAVDERYRFFSFGDAMLLD